MIIGWMACVPPDGDVVVRVPVHDPGEVARLQELGDVWTEHPIDAVDVRVDAGRRWRLPPHDVVIEDVETAIEDHLRRAGDGFYEDWRTLDELEERLALLDARSELATVRLLGHSVEGRPIHGLELRTAPFDDRPGVLVTATQHAREWVAASSATWLAEHLVDGAGVDPEVDAFLAANRVLIVPVVNPDGYEYTWTTDRLWRKNRRDNRDGTFGVDLNRNWDVGFGGPGSAAGTRSDNYRGPSAFSEPETDAIRAFLDTHPRYGVHVDLHCTGQLVLSPFGFTAAPSPDAGVLDPGGADAADAMGAVHGSVYDAGPINTRLYPASGTATDWSYARRGLASWLVELRDRGRYGFLLPADQIVPTAEEAWAGLLALADVAPVRLGLVPQGEVVAGSTAEVWASRTSQGREARLWATTEGVGETVAPSGVVLELAAPEEVAADRAGIRGWSRFTFDVPRNAAGAEVWLQAEDGVLTSVPLALEVE